MTKDELSSIVNNLTNGDLIRIEFNSEKNAKGAMEGRFMNTYNGAKAFPNEETENHIYLHFTDGVRVFDIWGVYAPLINNITVLEKWEGKQE
jgi:hypothetical protein